MLCFQLKGAQQALMLWYRFSLVLPFVNIKLVSLQQHSSFCKSRFFMAKLSIFTMFVLCKLFLSHLLPPNSHVRWHFFCFFGKPNTTPEQKGKEKRMLQDEISLKMVPEADNLTQHNTQLRNEISKFCTSISFCTCLWTNENCISS